MTQYLVGRLLWLGRRLKPEWTCRVIKREGPYPNNPDARVIAISSHRCASSRGYWENMIPDDLINTYNGKNTKEGKEPSAGRIMLLLAQKECKMAKSSCEDRPSTRENNLLLAFSFLPI